MRRFKTKRRKPVSIRSAYHATLAAMELRHLHSFLALVKQRHFGRAAEEVKLSQPALSQQIKALEKELGVTLVIRDPAGLRLTDAGTEFIAHARRILRDVDAARDAVYPVDVEKRPELRIGFTSRNREEAFIAANHAMNCVPDLRVAFDELSALRIEAGIDDARLDVGIVDCRTNLRKSAHEVVAAPPLRLLWSPNPKQKHPFHDLRHRPIERLDELADERFVLPHGSEDRLRPLIDDYFERQRFVPNIAVETNSLPDTLRFVTDGLVTVGSEPMATSWRDRFTGLMDLPEAPAARIYLLWRDPEMPSVAELAFADKLRELLGQWREPLASERAQPWKPMAG